MPVVSLPGRTLVTYGLQKLPERIRPNDQRVFIWQDKGFDKSVARKVSPDRSDIIHGIPGQSHETFKKARQLGIPCVLNHASGPVSEQRRLIRAEYIRAGFDLDQISPFPPEWKCRLEQEMSLADRHCVASTVVRDQLVRSGVDPDSIWIVPYGLENDCFKKRPTPPDGNFRVCFAGRQSLRKGIFHLLRALETCSKSDWEVHFFGAPLAETRQDMDSYTGKAKVLHHGPVSQKVLAEAFRSMHVLVLPSAEEAFGLVVLQALQCGVPCIVSDRVGAKDLIRDRETGSIFDYGSEEQLAEALCFWEARRGQVKDTFPAMEPARKLVTLTESLLSGNA